MSNSYVRVKNKKFKSPYKREDLEQYLQWLGLRWDKNNERVISIPKFRFIKDCIREDLGFADDLELKITWFDNGNAFSQARDPHGNQVFNILLGENRTKFQTAFDNKSFKFLGIYHDQKAISFDKMLSLAS